MLRGCYTLFLLFSCVIIFTRIECKINGINEGDTKRRLLQQKYTKNIEIQFNNEVLEEATEKTPLVARTKNFSTRIRKKRWASAKSSPIAKFFNEIFKSPFSLFKRYSKRRFNDHERSKLTELSIDFSPNILVRLLVETTLEETLKEEQGQGCEIPYTDPMSVEFLVHSKTYPLPKCKTKDWVRCYHDVCKVDREILRNYTDIRCVYRDIVYINDEEYRLGKRTILYGKQELKLKNSDYVVVACKGVRRRRKKSIFHIFDLKHTWNGNVAGFRPVSLKVPPGRENTYNVLIFGFDSLARNGFIRNMPKSYNYLKNEFGATILQSYNIVGEGTPAALIPLLTGSNELELPDCRKGIRNSVHTDFMPLIFYKLKKDGYQTLYFEDSPDMHTFNNRLNGFLRQPTDHYIRPLLLKESSPIREWFNYGESNFCVGDTPQFKLFMNLTDQFFQLDGKKFAFTFIVDISHSNIDRIKWADEPTVEFLKGLKDKGVCDNTLIILIGDHGPRYNSDRQNNLQGKLEERLPLLAIKLPNDLVRRRPSAQKALEENSNVLTTVHDVYATIIDVIDMKQHWNMHKLKGTNLTRALTLLDPIPKSRSCSEAGIEQHWCACYQWQNMTNLDPMYERTAQALIEKINSLTAFVRTKCALRALKYIHWVMRKIPNKKVEQYNGVVDSDGFVGKFKTDSSISVDRQFYQVKVTAGPGKATYEGTVMYIVKERKLVVSPTAISRTNAYNTEPKCISKIFPHLNPYCYCVL